MLLLIESAMPSKIEWMPRAKRSYVDTAQEYMLLQGLSVDL